MGEGEVGDREGEQSHVDQLEAMEEVCTAHLVSRAGAGAPSQCCQRAGGLSTGPAR